MKRFRLELSLFVAGLIVFAVLEFLQISARYSSLPSGRAVELKVANGRVGIGVMPSGGFGFNEFHTSLGRDETLVERDRFADDSDFLAIFPIWLLLAPVILSLVSLLFCRLHRAQTRGAEQASDGKPYTAVS